ncbi:MAG: dTMP kinase [bacterium]
MKGLLISFEGIDFSGKSVQANLLKQRLLSEGRPVQFLREPGGTEISERLRDVVLDTKHYTMSPLTEVLLYSAARAQMVEEQVLPNLSKGVVVICDRFYDSTTAYQGYGRSIDLDFIAQLNQRVTRGCKPDLTFLLDLHPETVLKRKLASAKSLDRLEQEDVDFHLKVRQGYLTIARNDSKRFVVLDGEKSIETIQEEIYQRVKSKLRSRAG